MPLVYFAYALVKSFSPVLKLFILKMLGERKVEVKRVYGIPCKPSTELVCDSQQGLLAIGLSNGLFKVYPQSFPS